MSGTKAWLTFHETLVPEDSQVSVAVQVSSILFLRNCTPSINLLYLAIESAFNIIVIYNFFCRIKLEKNSSIVRGDSLKACTMATDMI